MPRKRTKSEPQAQEPAAQREPGDDTIAVANPRPWAHNNDAGAEYLTRSDPYEFLIRFKDKPSAEVLATLREADFHWNSENKWWARPIGYKTQAQDREIGRRTYGKVVEMIVKEKGLTQEQGQVEGVPF